MNEEENRFEEAAIEAEFETGYREETREEARRGVVTRLLRMTSGSLVTIIGLFDILNVAKSSITDSKWLGLEWEAYAFVALVFWIFCFSMSRYSQWLEKRLDTGHGS